MRELDGVFQGKRYSFARHWDQVIIGYRECERSLFKFSAQNQRTIQRLNDAIVTCPPDLCPTPRRADSAPLLYSPALLLHLLQGPGVNLFPHVHVLDIHEVLRSSLTGTDTRTHTTHTHTHQH